MRYTLSVEASQLLRLICHPPAHERDELGSAKVQGGRRADNAKLDGMERSYAAENARELERLRALVSTLSDQDLGSLVNETWTVPRLLGHMALCHRRALSLPP